MIRGLDRLVLRAAPFCGLLLAAVVLLAGAPALGSLPAAVCMAVAFALVLPLARPPRPGSSIGPAFMFLIAVFFASSLTTPFAGGLTAFILLPVLWMALHGSRRELAIAVAGVAAYFILPIAVVGGPEHPESEWPRGLIVAGVAASAGLLVQRLVRQVRDQTDAAVRRQEELERLLGLLAGIARADDVRGAVCDTARTVTGARACVLLERDGEDRLVMTAAVGTSAHQTIVAPDHALLAQGGALVADPGAEGLGWLADALGGARSIGIEPVVGPGVTGVLAVGWDRPVEGRSDALALLAADAVSAIARADLLAELQSLALRDPLTGLPNRRAWDDALAAAVARAERDGSLLSVALLDVDDFKEFNDTYGHQAGDRLLKEAAAAWQSRLREGDVLARWGGDEFALLLAGEPAQDALVIAERLIGAVPQHGCSAGVAEWKRSEDADALLARADAELYAAKARRSSGQTA